MSRLRFSGAVFLALGTGCLIATLLTSRYWALSPAEILPALLAEGALIFLSALVIERTLLAEFDSSASRRTQHLIDTVTESITAFFRTRFDDLKYADQYNVHLVPPRRSTTKNPGVTYERIAAAIRRASTLKILCTSGIDIFPPANTMPTPIVNAIRYKAQAPEPFALVVLSCNPDGEYARVRGTLENAVNPNYVKRDIEDSQASLRQIASAAQTGFTWRWFTYGFVPQAWFLLTDTEGFVEVYHFGLRRRAPHDPNSCIGGRVPMLHVSAGSGLWQALNEYFDFLATPGADQTLEEARTNFFAVAEISSGSRNGGLGGPHIQTAITPGSPTEPSATPGR